MLLLAEQQFSRLTGTNSSGGGGLPASHIPPSSAHYAVSLSQRFSNAAGPSASLLAANGEFNRGSKSALPEGSRHCPAQMDLDKDPHGNTNPSSFLFDYSTGYIPIATQASRPLPQSQLESTWKSGTGHLSLKSFLEGVSSERLNRMPHRASRWDRGIRMLEGMYWLSSATLSSG